MVVYILFILALAITIAVPIIRNKLATPSASDNNCYTIQAKEGSSMMIKDSGYIINSIGHFVGEGSKSGLNNIDIRVDLRYTQKSAIYKALGALENEEGIKISEKETSNPMSMVFNVQWVKLPGAL